MQVASWYNPTRAQHVHLAYMRLRPNWERDQSRASAGLVLVGRSSITSPKCGKMGYRAFYCHTLAQPTAWNESMIHGPLTCHSNSDTRRSPHPVCSTPLPFPSSYLTHIHLLLRGLLPRLGVGSSCLCKVPSQLKLSPSFFPRLLQPTLACVQKSTHPSWAV